MHPGVVPSDAGVTADAMGRAARKAAAACPAPRLPPDCWEQVFGNRNPVTIEIGPGLGHFLLDSARADPRFNFFAIERSRARSRALEEKLARARLENVRVVTADAACVLPMLPDASVERYHIQFPDPWWKRRHSRRRLVTTAVVSQIARTLSAGGTIELITDVRAYFDTAQEILRGEARLEPVGVSTGAQLVSGFARKALARGSSLCACVYRRR